MVKYITHKYSLQGVTCIHNTLIGVYEPKNMKIKKRIIMTWHSEIMCMNWRILPATLFNSLKEHSLKNPHQIAYRYPGLQRNGTSRYNKANRTSQADTNRTPFTLTDLTQKKTNLRRWNSSTQRRISTSCGGHGGGGGGTGARTGNR